MSTSQAIAAKVTTLYVSGQIAWDNQTKTMVSLEDVVAPTHQTMKNIDCIASNIETSISQEKN